MYTVYMYTVYVCDILRLGRIVSPPLSVLTYPFPVRPLLSPSVCPRLPQVRPPSPLSAINDLPFEALIGCHFRPNYSRMFSAVLIKTYYCSLSKLNAYKA